MKLCFPVLFVMLTTVAATPCIFNSMCTCKTDEALRMHIACVAVPLYTIPGNFIQFESLIISIRRVKYIRKVVYGFRRTI